MGSLGNAGEGPAQVESITVSNCNFFNTTNGVRIKSWQVTLKQHTHAFSVLCICVPCIRSKISSFNWWLHYSPNNIYDVMNAGRARQSERIHFQGPQHDWSTISYRHQPVLLPPWKLSRKGKETYSTQSPTHSPSSGQWLRLKLYWLRLQQEGVAITDARFINIQGTSSEQEAIKIMCSKSVPCHGIYLDNVDLSWCRHTAPTQAKVLNAHGSVAGKVKPQVQFSNRWSPVLSVVNIVLVDIDRGAVQRCLP